MIGFLPFFFNYQTPFEKGSTLKGNNLLPRGADFSLQILHFLSIPVQKGDKTELPSLKEYAF